MGKLGKAFVFIFVCFTIVVILTLLAGVMTSPVIFLGVIAIPFIYKSMFGKKKEQQISESNEIILDKASKDDSEINLKKE